MGLHQRERRHHHLHATLREIGAGQHDVAVGNLGHVEAGALEEAGEHQLGGPRHQRGVELAGLRARKRDQLDERADLERGRHGDDQNRVGDADDRIEVARLVRQLLELERMDRERSGRREQQRVIVIGIDEGGDRHDAVGAGPVLDHHGLPPPPGQAIRKKPRADGWFEIGAAFYRLGK